MGYLIIENGFAPKISSLWEAVGHKNSHAILVNYCNFKCDYCIVDYAGRKLYRDYSEQSFRKIVKGLIPKGCGFKFTGGEPSLSPTIERDLNIVKEYGGIVYFDTNGSNNVITRKLINQGLIDVIGISLKGITPETAQVHTGVSREKCWENVFDTIRFSAERIRTIVTVVCFSDFSLEILYAIVNLLPKSIYLKLNNYVMPKHKKTNMKEAADSKKLIEIATQFINDNPEWKHRLIIIDNETAVNDYRKITFL